VEREVFQLSIRLMLTVRHRFRWAYCQLDTLSRCLPPDIPQTLNELPDTLDDMYMQTFKRISKQKQHHAHRLLQCLVAAIRPLRVEELAQIFTIKFDTDAGYNMVENWRPENPEEQVLSACSTLVSVIDDENSKYVQFSHFSVKEFLISDRFRTSDIGNDFHYYVSLNDAHATLARACLTVLLQLGETIDKTHLVTFPLAFYAAQHWVNHAKFGDVALRIQDAMEQLFEPKEPYFRAWIWIRDVEGRGKPVINRLTECPSQPEETPLYYAAFYGFTGLAKHLITTRRENVNAKCGFRGSPLHAASREGQLDVARLLLDHGADVNLKSRFGRAPFRSAYDGRHLDVMRLLLKHGVDVDMRDGHGCGTLLHDASFHGQAGITRLLLEHNADVNARGDADRTPLHFASRYGYIQVVQLLLEYGADVNAMDRYSDTPLDDATQNQHHNIAQLLLEYGAVRVERTR
jgi:hypothetical protein